MKTISRLPDADEGADGLLRLAEELGDETTFNLIRLCRTTQGDNDVARQVMRILAIRLVNAEMRQSNTTVRVAGQTVGGRLGYSQANRYSFTDLLKDTPAGDALTDKAAPLMQLARQAGDAATFRFIRMCRAPRRSSDDFVFHAMHLLAKRLVAREETDTNVYYDTARRQVADRLGYSDPANGNGRHRFYKILSGYRETDQRPRGRTRK